MLEKKLLLNEKISIGIVGCGIVGGAISNYYKKINKYDVIEYDKYKQLGEFKDILNSDLLFLCLPTPFSEELKEYNISELSNTVQSLIKHKYKGYILIKSTINPGTIEKLINSNFNDDYELKIIHNPEFLSQKTANTDFENQKQIILGGKREYVIRVKEFYKRDFSVNITISTMTSNESEMVKLALNNFYAVKIQYFTELYLLCQKLNINYDNVKSSMLLNEWINPMHTQIPGHDGQVSYGGMCFPKDTNAFLNFVKQHSKHYAVLEATINERNELRND